MSALTCEQQRITKLALRLRYYQHQIAAFFGINQGRISEFKNSSLFDRVEPANELPAGFPQNG
jgi:predicted XRE-type DNA-binding protein